MLLVYKYQTCIIVFIYFETLSIRIVSYYGFIGCMSYCSLNKFYSINNSSRLYSYYVFKHDFRLENYLTCIMKNVQICVIPFPYSSQNSFSVTGRYENIKRQDRTCASCNMNLIELEYHIHLFVQSIAS